MSKEDFNLSSLEHCDNKGNKDDLFYKKDVKEFIRLLKEVGKDRLEGLPESYELFCEDIDELAGEELI